MTQMEVELPKGAAGMPGIIVPRKTVAEVHRLMEDGETEVTIELSPGKIRLAIGAGRLMAAQLFEIRSWDPRVFGFSILALAVCAAGASILPAQRAASTDPMKALRTD